MVVRNFTPKVSMRKPKIWYCKVYKIYYYFFLNWSRQDFYLYYSKKLSGGKHSREDFNSFSGLCVEFSNPNGVAIWTDPEDKKHHNRALMHECIHAACFSLDLRGVGIDWPTCEPITYLAEAIFYEALHKGKK